MGQTMDDQENHDRIVSVKVQLKNLGHVVQ